MEFDTALTAWATLVLASLALIAAAVAWKAWKTQAAQLKDLQEVNAKQLPVLERQLPVLQGQLEELEVSRQQREREDRERREAFVSQVFIWHEIAASTAPPGLVEQRLAVAGPPVAPLAVGETSRIWIRNTAPVPVYDVRFAWWYDGELVGWGETATPVMPGTDDESTTGRPWGIREGIDREKLQVAAFIRDAAGNLWRLREGGHHEPFDESMLPVGRWKTT